MKKTVFLLFVLLSLLLPSRSILFAQESRDESYIGGYYEPTTIKKLGMLYWALGLLDIENDSHVDNFLMINECDIFKNYYGRDFEWRNVRESGRDFIENNKADFPLRFSLVIPLWLGEYNFEEQSFDILDKYKINNIRRFEILSEDYSNSVCDMPYGYNMEGYSYGIIVELTRPLFLDSLSVPPEIAKEYIEKKMNVLGANSYSRREKMFDVRDAYLVMNVKFFAAKKEKEYIDGLNYERLMAVLESYQVYAEQSRDTLLYQKKLRKRKKRSSVEQKLQKEYEVRKKELQNLNILEAEKSSTKEGG